MGFWTGVTGQPLSDLDWSGLTHIMHVAVAPNSDGSLTFTCSIGPCPESQLASEAGTLIATAHSHNVKVLLNMGNVPGYLYAGAITGNLFGFVQNITNVVNSYGYDGVDIDWEQNRDDALLTTLVTSLRSAMGGKLLTIDVDGSAPALYAALQPMLDRVNAMTYDGVGNWNPYSWFNAALYNDPCDCVWSFDLMKRRLLGAGLSPSKLNLGIPFYGWVSNGGGIGGPRQPGAAADLSQSNYYALYSNYDLSGATMDSVSQSPWLATSSGWVTFDNEQSVTAKVNYVKNNGLGGWIIWEIEQDYLPSHNPKHPLLSAIGSAMGGAGSVVSSAPAPVAAAPAPVAPSAAAPSPAPVTAALTGTPLPSGTVNVPYGFAFTLPDPSFYWVQVKGSMPSGLYFDPNTGVLAGTPFAAGGWSFDVLVTDPFWNITSTTYSMTVK
jgi:chitinase